MARTKDEPATAVPWWNWTFEHPLSDEAFAAAFRDWIFAKSDDHTVKHVRNRMDYFVRYYLRQQLAGSLAAYRKEHPL